MIRIFPNCESAYRLLGAFLMEIDEKWNNGRKYLDMTDYLEWRKTHAKTSSKVVRLG
ncbi:transposase [Paenibacillus alvei]|nr:transposase [Paenibacillus alvei]MBG9745668.1 transposase [Paenibacillus alvei]